jgi:Leucine-rich repeat (LRR) protein
MTVDAWQAFWDRPNVPARPLALGPEDSPMRPLEPRRVPFEVCLAYEYDSGLAAYAGAIVPIELVQDGDRQVVVQGRVGTATPDKPATLDGLAHIASVESVIVDRPVHLTRSLPQVRELMVTTGVAPPGTDVLRRLPNLRSLCLGRSAVDPKIDLRVLVDMPGLEDLRFDATAVATIEPLGRLTGLRRIRIENHSFESIGPLAAASGLRFVAVGWWKGMDRLGSLTALEEVELNEGTISSLRSFSRLTHLRSLTIFGRRLKRLDGIEELSALEDLFLYNSGIENLTPLVGLGRLRRLRLDVPSRVADFSPIGRLQHLEELIINLKGDRPVALPRVGDLADLRSLRGLALTGADGAGWEALLDLPGLERVLLYGSVDPEAPEVLRRRFPTARLDVRPVRHAGPRHPGPQELPDGRWWMRADARSLLGAKDNFEAEERLRSRLEQADPALLDRLELDSEADSLGIIGPTESDVRRAMQVLGLS